MKTIYLKKLVINVWEYGKIINVNKKHIKKPSRGY